ncbi:LysR family transcriptional regulator [Kutzneria viridogrisea]|uniref:DNA-binding transcriptional LysR family regulator n=1 Tax=Kutzneria viridogrisea TaxID=47990 RepID=A0ABR6BEC4_9PSEU|nr:DNA-binding transcriptional LysR family regulator [Kutzneria viridogrisea]
MFDLHRLRLLRELHTRGTLAAVAAALGYSGSAISQQLALLEKEAGVALLERVGRGVRLTPQALILVEHAEVVLARLELAEAEMQASLGEPRGVVRLAVFQTAMLSLVPPLVDHLREQAPGTRLRVRQLEPGPALSALAAGEVDLVVAEEFPGHPEPRLAGVDRVDLAREPMVLAVPEALAGMDLADLADRPWVLEPADTPSGRWALALCREAGFEPDIAYSSTDVVVHLRLVETGLAVAILPELVLRGSVPPGVGLRPLRGHRQIYTCARSGSARRPVIAATRAALRAVYAMP